MGQTFSKATLEPARSDREKQLFLLLLLLWDNSSELSPPRPLAMPMLLLLRYVTIFLRTTLTGSSRQRLI